MATKFDKFRQAVMFTNFILGLFGSITKKSIKDIVNIDPDGPLATIAKDSSQVESQSKKVKG